jgi:NAD-dependent deacetylase
MSAESGVPTYRGRGGIWNQYKWENYACQSAFERDPEGVLEFHELRRIEALKCQPHRGHEIITDVQTQNPDTSVITQNIDGMHQRAKSKNVIELHGSLWRMRCESEKILKEDLDQGKYHTRKCDCGNWLRPDIIWFQDMLNDKTVLEATQAIASCDLFISIGTSAVVWPAAGYPKLAKSSGAFCVEINPEATELSALYDQTFRMTASAGLEHLFN